MSAVLSIYCDGPGCGASIVIRRPTALGIRPRGWMRARGSYSATAQRAHCDLCPACGRRVRWAAEVRASRLRARQRDQHVHGRPKFARAIVASVALAAISRKDEYHVWHAVDVVTERDIVGRVSSEAA